jgi:hypothetical protein
MQRQVLLYPPLDVRDKVDIKGELFNVVLRPGL